MALLHGLLKVHLSNSAALSKDPIISNPHGKAKDLMGHPGKMQNDITGVTLCPGTFAAGFGGFCRQKKRQLHLGILRTTMSQFITHKAWDIFRTRQFFCFGL